MSTQAMDHPVGEPAKLQVKIGGMQCSFCVESIRKAYSRTDGVSDVGVSLSHEEALIHYDPQRVTPGELEKTLRSMGYTVRDPDKVRTFEEENAEVRGHRNRLIVAGGHPLRVLRRANQDRPQPASGSDPGQRQPRGATGESHVG